MASKLRVHALTEREFDEWEDLVAHAPGGSIYATAGYLETLCRAAGGTFRILVVRRGEELVGGIGLYLRSGLGGTYVAPRLLLYYNGPVLREYPTKYPSQSTARQVAVLDALAEAVEGLGLGAVTIKARSPVADARPWLERGWSAAPAYSYVVPLTDLGAQWQRVEQNLRRLVKRCDQQGFAFSEDDDFDGFYRLHVATLGRKGAAPYLPPGAFQAFFRQLHGRGEARLYHARDAAGRPMSSQIVLLGPHAVSHTVCAAAAPDARASGVTAFLRWRAFEALANLGSVANDLTDAALNPVTHFKSQLGGSLELSFVLTAQPRARYLLVDRIQRAAGRLRRAAGTVARAAGVRRGR